MRITSFYNSCKVFKIYNHIVIENPLKMVVNMTTVLVSIPVCPIFFAITKHETVVAEPSITRIAMSCSPWNPK